MVIDSVSTTERNRYPVRIANLKSADLWLKPNTRIDVIREVTCLVNQEESEVEFFKTNDYEETIVLKAEINEINSKQDISLDFLKELNCSETEKQKIMDLIEKHQYVFISGELDLRYTTTMQHQIKLSDDKPVAQPHRRIPPSQYEEVKAHIKDLLAKNIIRETYQRTVESIEYEVEEKHEQPDKDGIFKGLCNQVSALPRYSNSDMKLMQNSDNTIKQFLIYFNEQRKPSSSERMKESPKVISMLRQKDRMFLKNGILFRKVTDPQQGETHQFVVPEALQKQVLEMLHEQAGHQGIERTTSLIRSRCYWTGMFKDIDTYCKTCERCNVAKMPCPRISVPMSHLLASKPNEILAMDFTILEPANDEDGNISDNRHQYVSEHLNKMKIAYEKAGELLSKEAVLREKAHNTKASEHKLGVGTRVLIRNRVQCRNKIQDKWNSLQFQVIKCLDSDRHVYLIEPIDKSGQPRVENRTNLQVCKFKPQTDSDSSSDEDPIAVGYNGYRQLRRSNRSNLVNTQMFIMNQDQLFKIVFSYL
ncbi:unnamed protein product [Mytilus coruscus]|uniref:Integrase zinc-binding domain-containing protein n=1 Tax=Mytilus coruscus TaxID=42192 RepID=A0A6J8DZQ9_MYTCO|nr:unnamed protein product [Mytilus coruscus]